MQCKCDNCGFVCDEDELGAGLSDTPDLGERLEPGSVVPAGECPKCGCLSYVMEEGAGVHWDTICEAMGLDPSFQYSDEQMAAYEAAYLASEQRIARSLEFVAKVANYKKWGEPDEDNDGEPFEPSDGLDDSHSCLMDLIDEAREIMAPDQRSDGKSVVPSDGSMDIVAAPDQGGDGDETLEMLKALAVQYGWSDVELVHARNNFGLRYGVETIVCLVNGRELRAPAYPEVCDYVRIVQGGHELAYWDADELGDDPADVLGAIIGAAHG